jgi:hypothetical protein
MGTLGRSDFIGIERQRARARSLESGKEGRAANGVGAHDHAAGRTGHANVRAWPPGRRPKNGDISPVRCDRQIGCHPRLHGARGKTIGEINGMKRVEQARTSRITCMPAQARAMLTNTRGSRRARRIRRLTTCGQAARRPTAKRDHRHLVRSFQRADEFERRRRRMPSRVMRFASEKRLRYRDAFTMHPRRRDVKNNLRERI